MLSLILVGALQNFAYKTFLTKDEDIISLNVLYLDVFCKALYIERKLGVTFKVQACCNRPYRYSTVN